MRISVFNDGGIGVWKIVRYLWKLLNLAIFEEQSGTRLYTSRYGFTPNSKPIGDFALKFAGPESVQKQSLLPEPVQFPPEPMSSFCFSNTLCAIPCIWLSPYKNRVCDLSPCIFSWARKCSYFNTILCQSQCIHLNPYINRVYYLSQCIYPPQPVQIFH